MGSSIGVDQSHFWEDRRVVEFLGDEIGDVINIFISHNDWDHYSILPDVFDSLEVMPRLENIYTTCTSKEFPSTVDEWVTEVGLEGFLREFNNGAECGMNGIDCDAIDICPGTSISSKVLTANYGENCDGGNKNQDSIVIKMIYGDVSILLTGDFEDDTPDEDADDAQKALVDYYGDELISTIYQISHHGASYQANKAVMRNAVAPKAVFATGDPWFSYEHPRCLVIDGFIDEVQSLCKPLATEGDSFYCGPAFTESSTRLQETFTCGDEEGGLELRQNDYAIYTMAPEEDIISTTMITTDGVAWEMNTDYEFR